MSRSVSAVSMARSEYCRCPPRLPTPTASQVAIASGATHTVISPRWTSARSYAGQFPTWYCVVYFGCTLDFMSRSCACCRHDGQEVDRGSPRARDPCTNAADRPQDAPSGVHVGVAAAGGRPPGGGAHHWDRALVHESELARNDPHPEAPHLPISYDSGPPRSVIRFRMLHASSASALCPPGVRARRPVPMIDLYLKKAFSTRACRW